MKTGLRYVIIALAAFTLFWAGITVMLWFNVYGWPAFAVSGVVALAVGIPVGMWITRLIKRRDPNWPSRRRSQQQSG